MRQVIHPKYELATLLREQDLETITPNRWKQRTLFALSKCRTQALGGHIDQCNNPSCSKLHISYNSCRNRHCPKCQGHKREAWIQAREKDLLNCSYFHVVFTLPDALNPLALSKPKAVYNALFNASWQTISGFAQNPKFLGAKTGMVAVLHTWGQNLNLHPHLHCIVPAGGLTQQDKWRNTKSKGKYLFPVKAMSKVFRSKFTEVLSEQLPIPSEMRKKLFSKNWVVYAKQPFYGPQQVIEYLGRYTHKIAISNHRIKSLKNDYVRFTAKNYRIGGKTELLQLSKHEFIRRFCMHILPKGFTKMRHYGILSGAVKQKNKTKIEPQLGAVKPVKQQRVIHHRPCPYCKVGTLETLLIFDERGPPASWLKRLEVQNNQPFKN